MADEAARPEELERMREELLSRAMPLYRDTNRKKWCLVVAIIALLAGAVAWHWSVWASILLAAGGIISWAYGEAALRARCPGCKRWVRVKGLRARCVACGQESAVMQKYLTPIAPGFICDAPLFRSAIRELRGPEKWRWPWPGSCALCAKPAMREEELALRLVFGNPGPGLKRVDSYRFPIPHCSQHSRGVSFLETGARLEFRSFDYWNAFLALNREEASSPASLFTNKSGRN